MEPIDCETPTMEETINRDVLFEENEHGPRPFSFNEPDVDETNMKIMRAVEMQLYRNDATNKFTVSNVENNWPPLPKLCCIRSCFYQNIEFDIPIQFQKFIYFLYYIWMFHGIINFLNLVAGIIIMDKTVIIFSFFYTLFCLFYSFVGWYRCAYKAFSKQSSHYFLAFLYTFFLQFLMVIVQSLGVPNSGTIGFLTALNAIPESENLHIMVGIIVACGCCSVAVLDFIGIAMVSKMHPQIVAFFLKNVNETPRTRSIGIQ